MHTEFFRSKKTPNEKSIYAPFEPFYYTVQRLKSKIFEKFSSRGSPKGPGVKKKKSQNIDFNL